MIVIAGVGWYIYAKKHQTAPGVPAVTDFGAFFPVGADVNPNIPGTLQSPESIAVQATQTQSSPFKQLSPDAVAGFTSFISTWKRTIPADPSIPKSKPTTETVTNHTVRYVSRNNGYVYEIVDGSIPLQITNIYIPNIYEAVFGDNHQTALVRFLRDDQQTIATYSVPIPPPNPDGTRTQKEGVYFPDNILQAVASPEGSQIIRLTSDPTSALISTTTPVNTKKVDVLRTPFREWILSWPTAKTLYAQTKASAQVPGFLYKIDTTEKKFRRVLGNINGLTTLVSPNGTYILYSQNSGNEFITKLLNTKTNTTQNFSLRILPEKCVWLQNEDLICAGNTSVPEAQYPDAWYQGIVSFSDQLYHIYSGTALYETLYDSTDRVFDMTNLTVDEGTHVIYFINKPTGVLWQMTY